jgi:hypothetical protein
VAATFRAHYTYERFIAARHMEALPSAEELSKFIESDREAIESSMR